MNVLRLFGYAVLHLLPYTILEYWLKRRFAVPGYVFSVRFSGRTALFELASALRKESNSKVALYPDYVCNIVPRVLTETGWNGEAYPTDDTFEANWRHLEERMNRGDVGLLVGASVFGSSGLLDDLSNSRKLATLRAWGVKAIADLSQDVRLVSKLPEYGNDVISGVVSFNDKSFPGAMGGGILAMGALPQPGLLLNTSQRRFLYKRMVGSNLAPYFKRFRFKAHTGAFEYSSCDPFPFKLNDCYRPSKLQLVCGLQGILLSGRYQVAKRRFLDKRINLQTRFAASAAYLVVKSHDMTLADRKRKPTYAIEGNPGASLRPDLLITHNKGFDDHA